MALTTNMPVYTVDAYTAELEPLPRHKPAEFDCIGIAVDDYIMLQHVDNVSG